jgi:anti-sigma regulatory factor (Ser/Thr protein kinase)
MGRKGGTQMREQTFPATTEALNDAMAFVDETLEEAGCSMKVQMQIDIAVEEIFVNIAHYAYTPGTGDAVLRVELQENPRAVSITFEDRGVPYDPLAKEDPDVTLDAEERQIGGLGIYMVKKSMDEVKYRHEDGKNILTLVKCL